MIKVYMSETSYPIIFEQVKNAYTKGALYCVYDGTTVTKFPLLNIFKVEETYTN